MGDRLDVATGRVLRSRLTCPNCWKHFTPEQVCFVAAHTELREDPKVGADEQRRFRPRRFTLDGEAIDPMGLPTSLMACPHCHLSVASSLLELNPLFVSLIGAPASGKSYYLATLAWHLRHLLPHFGVSFSDADPVGNARLHEYEQTLFMNPDPDRLTEIAKTQQQDSLLHQTVTLAGEHIRYPRPLTFTLWPSKGHPNYTAASTAGSVLVMYDNAGEDFRPTTDESGSTVTQHVARAHVLLFMYDLTQDQRFRPLARSNDPQLKPEGSGGARRAVAQDRHDGILRHLGLCIRRHLGLPSEVPLRTPLIVVVPKFDIWSQTFNVDIDEEPVCKDDRGELRVDLKRIEDTSQAIRSVLFSVAPDMVTTAESLSSHVVYIPLSSLGCSPTVEERGGSRILGVCPKDIKPRWVTVPIQYVLAKWHGRLVFADGPQGAASEE